MRALCSQPRSDEKYFISHRRNHKSGHPPSRHCFQFINGSEIQSSPEIHSIDEEIYLDFMEQSPKSRLGTDGPSRCCRGGEPLQMCMSKLALMLTPAPPREPNPHLVWLAIAAFLPAQKAGPQEGRATATCHCTATTCWVPVSIPLISNDSMHRSETGDLR